MFVEIPHTADIAIYVESTSLERLFYDAAIGLMAISGIYPSDDKTFYIENYEIKFDELEVALVDFLNFLVYILDKQEYLIDCLIKLDEYTVYTKCYIGKYKKRNVYIKSTTFYNLQIVRYNNLYFTYIVFDI